MPLRLAGEEGLEALWGEIVELCNEDLVDNGANASERTKVSIGECAEDFELLKRILSERQN